MVENEAEFSQVLSDFDKWLFEEDPGKFTFIICGDWDLKTMLPKQCKTSSVNVPEYMREWINIKKSYHAAKRNFPRSLPVVLYFLSYLYSGLKILLFSVLFRNVLTLFKNATYLGDLKLLICTRLSLSHPFDTS